MKQKAKKEYIVRTWNTSSGKRISEMLKRYWNLKESVLVEKSDEQIRDEIKSAEEVFGDISDGT